MLLVQIYNFWNRNFIYRPRMQSSERSEREFFWRNREKKPYNEIWDPEVGICIYASPWPNSGGRIPSTPGCDGGGEGTLLQNLWKMLFKQKYFYLLKIWGGGGPPWAPWARRHWRQVNHLIMMQPPSTLSGMVKWVSALGLRNKKA